MTVDLRDLLRAPLTLAANPHFYDYIHYVHLRESGAVEMISGSGQALRRRIVGQHRILDATASEADLHLFDLLDVDPYERRPETSQVADLTVHIRLAAGPFALRREVVWNVTEEERPWLLFDHRLVFSHDPLSAGQPEMPADLLDHPDVLANPEARAFFEDMLRRAEAARQYYSSASGEELPQREILRLGLPPAAMIL